MAVLKKYNLAGKEVGEETLDDAFVDSSANQQMIKDYLVALRANARQWSASTKTRAEVCHSGKKPHPQKGTGRARQGYLGSPQFKGGGRVHAPRPKYNQHVSINKKERRAAIRHLVIEKILENKLHILQVGALDEPKTKAVADFLKGRNLCEARVLFVGEGVLEGNNETTRRDAEERYDVFVKSMRNIPKKEFLVFSAMGGYDVAKNHEIFLMEPALDELKMLLGS